MIPTRVHMLCWKKVFEDLWRINYLCVYKGVLIKRKVTYDFMINYFYFFGFG